MGRPPCCDKVGVKKGPWTPEEDIMLVSYIQLHGPGNWRAVPSVTGLKRCSKSCRLRWTNYLRPGIKRGSFTDHEEKMITQLQALLGNKWAAIASYLPERTDNDVKNYWNTHLKKKLKKLQTGSGPNHPSSSAGLSPSSHSISRGQWERRLQVDINTAKQGLHDALSFEKTNHFTELLVLTSTGSYPGQTKPGPVTPYASSTDNIARLLKQWVKNPTKMKSEESSKCSSSHNSSNNLMKMEYSNYSEELIPSPSHDSKCGVDLSEAYDSLFGFESFGSSHHCSRSTSPSLVCGETKPDDPSGLAPLSMFENWLLGDQGKDLLNLPFDDPVLF